MVTACTCGAVLLFAAARLRSDGGKTVVLRVRSPLPKGAAAVASLPGRFFYLQVPNVSDVTVTVHMH